MFGEFGYVVPRNDGPLGVDEVGVSFGKVCVLMIRIADHLVGGADTFVNVGQQWVRENLDI